MCHEKEIEKTIKYHFGNDYINHKINKFVPRISQQSSFYVLKDPDLLSKSIYFWSNKNRTGKSSYISMIFREIVHRYGYGLSKVFKDSELQSECRISWLENSPDYLQEHYKSTKFLIFKDLGKATISKDEAQAYYFDFMDYLFSNCPPKVLYFASNYPPSKLAELPGRNWQDIAARINEKCEIIEVK
jgi:hypothetical protein